MKTSVTLSTFQAGKNAPVLFSGAKEEHFESIKSLGYDGIDLFLDDPTGESAKIVKKMLQKYNLGVGVIMPTALAGQGLFLGDNDPDIRKKCVEKFTEVIHFAADVGGMMAVGYVRGVRKGEETLAHFSKKLEESCSQLVKVNEKVSLAMEPINRYESNTFCTTEESVDFLRKTGLPMGLLLDTFQMNIEDVDLFQAFREAKDYTKHIHFVDSNRLAPSMGHLPMKELYQCVAELGYDDYLCVEALAKPDGITCATKGAEFFKEMKK